jgi:hypothetical protein
MNDDNARPEDEAIADELARKKMREVVGDELLRKQIREAAENKKEGQLERITKNPMVSVVAGFLLTGVIGALLVSYLEASRQKAERRAAEDQVRYTASVSAIHEFTKLVYERRERTALLYSALKRDASDAEITDRKTKYDEVYVKWASNEQSNLFFIRTALKDKSYNEFEQTVEQNLVPIFRKLDGCLTTGYDNFKKKSAPFFPKDCDPGKDLQTALDCSYAITDELFKLVAFPTTGPDTRTIDERKSALDEIHRRCAG